MTFDELKEIVAEILGADEDKITPEANLIDDLEADSLSIMELHMEIEEKQELKFPMKPLLTFIRYRTFWMPLSPTNKE